MTVKKILRTLAIVIVLCVNIGCDQISKNMARQTLETGSTLNVIDNYFILTKVENTGAFLSLGNSLPGILKTILLTILPIVVILLVLIYLFRSKIATHLAIGLSFIAGGGIGNIYDRLVYGSVTDFMHIDMVIFKTGIFNMADVSIMIGMIILLFGSFFKSTRSDEQLKDEAAHDPFI